MNAVKRRAAWIMSLALILGGGLGSVAMAQAAGRGHQDAPKYRSSIQVPKDAKESDERAEERNEKGENDEKAEGREEGGAEEQGESAKLASLARITKEQARAAAVAQVPGTVTGVELENEDGNLVYSVSVKTSAGEQDVKVDAGNGKVLHVEKDGGDGNEQ